VVAYTYDAAGQVLTKDYFATAGIDFVYTYDSHGNLTSARDSAGVTTMTYDLATDRLTRIEYPGGHWFAFTYDAAGRHESRTDETGRVVRYHYDPLGQLNTMTVTARAARRLRLRPRRSAQQEDARQRGVHDLRVRPGRQRHAPDQLPARRAVLSRFDYTYDASGRRTSMTTLDGTFTYGYDALGQLPGWSTPTAAS
jgi:YD repeat-containing protein